MKKEIMLLGLLGIALQGNATDQLEVRFGIGELVRDDFLAYDDGEYSDQYQDQYDREQEQKRERQRQQKKQKDQNKQRDRYYHDDGSDGTCGEGTCS